MKYDLVVVGPSFFGYSEAICSELSKLGFKSIFVDERYSYSSLFKVLLRLNIYIISYLVQRNMQKRIYKKLLIYKPKYILFLNSEIATSSFTVLLRKHIPVKKIIHYIWDSVNVKPSITQCIHKNFNKLIFFDIFDAKKYKGLHLNLFYEDVFNKDISNFCKNILYDVVTICSFHSDRIKVLNLFTNNHPNLKTRFIMYCPTLIHLYVAKLLKIFNNNSSILLTTKKLSKYDISQIFANSRSILDITHPTQSGLTSRTSETLACGKVLITTNELISVYIKSLDNVIIINRQNPIVDNIPDYIPINENILSLNNWTKQIVSILLEN